MAAEAGLSVDGEGFRRLMKEQKDRAKADARAKKLVTPMLVSTAKFWIQPVPQISLVMLIRQARQRFLQLWWMAKP